MADKKKTQLLATSSEINEIEQKRAVAVMQNPTFIDWVREFRRKFIVQGFLKPVYAVSGRFSIAELRVAKFGDYILPWKMRGEVFHESPKAWIRAEDTWFWLYLTGGQKLIPLETSIPKKYKIKDNPANLAWQEIVTITKQLKLFGVTGGGILIAPQDLEGDYLVQDEAETGTDDNKEGSFEYYKLPSVSRWIKKFQQYDHDLNLPFEVRPPWYHLAKYAIYNFPLNKLPVVSTVLSDKGQVDLVSFPSSDLSSKAREQIGRKVLRLPEQIQKRTEAFSIRKEQRDMTWWLWHEVGHGKRGKTITSGQIAVITGAPLSSVKTSISRFNERLKRELDGILLGRMLKAAIAMGLDPNQTFRVLNKKGLVPSRDREFDGFDDLNKLI